MTATLAKIKGSNKTVPRAANAGTTASKELSSLTRSQDIPYGFCHCGCGQKTTIASRNRAANGMVKGQPMKFVRTHSHRSRGPRYIEEDRGYDTPCWIWQRYTNRWGYGVVGGSHRSRLLAHRSFYENLVGPIPEGLQLDHLCRVRSCVNPAHMEPVTAAENTRRSSRAKLTRKQASAIKRAAFGTETQAQIAARFEISYQNVGAIHAGRTWRDVEPLTPRQVAAALNELSKEGQ